MTTTPRQTWRRGEAYEIAVLVGTAICLWFCGESVGLFAYLEPFVIKSGLLRIMIFGSTMCFVLAALSVFKSLRLRNALRNAVRADKRALILERHDAMTGLPNRRLLAETIDASVAKLSPEQGYAVLLLDLDRFKPVNDMHGHAAGDAVIYETAARLTHLVTPYEGMVARVGGDEFGVLVPYDPRSDDIAGLAGMMIASVSEPISWDQAQLEIGATIGIAISGQDGSLAEDLFRCAEIAMYCGKRDGHSVHRFFEPAMDEELQARLSLEAGLRAAIASGQIKPHYQALVKLPGDDLIGFEVLARWYHPERGIIGPDAFIPVAEECGLISDLSFGMLRQACRDARSWPEHLTLAVNVSPVQLEDRLLAPRILALLVEEQFPATRLEIEVTESALTSDLETARLTLKTLQQAGVSIALDDFGTGYSSLCNLREINFDKIKIDRSFVQTLGDNEESSKIVAAIVGLGKSLGIKTTAEGIENVGNSDWLARQGCTTGQGFLFGKPVPASAIDAMFGTASGTGRSAA